jgi:hypothetical protein
MSIDIANQSFLQVENIFGWLAQLIDVDVY